MQNKRNLNVDPSAPVSSILASWNDIMAQTQLNSPVPSDYHTDDYSTPPTSMGRNLNNRSSVSGYSPMNTSMQSSLGDSLDISNADFEVGTIAARKSLEKSNLRGRRNSISSPQLGPSRGVPQAKITASPEIGRSSSAHHGRDFPMATALSSIHLAGDQHNNMSRSGIARYGSVEQSYGEIFDMLNSPRGGGADDSFSPAAHQYHQQQPQQRASRMSSAGYGKPGSVDMPKARGSISKKEASKPVAADLSDFSDEDDDFKEKPGAPKGRAESKPSDPHSQRSVSQHRGKDPDIMGSDESDDNSSLESGDSETAQSHGIEGQSASLHSSSELGPPLKSISSISRQPPPSSVPKPKPADSSAGLGLRSSIRSSTGPQSHTNASKYNPNVDEDEDDYLDDMDEFDEAHRPKLEPKEVKRASFQTDPKAKGKDASRSSVAAPAVQEEKISPEELERRKSIAMIMQRWSVSNVDSLTAPAANSSPEADQVSAAPEVAKVSKETEIGATAKAVSATFEEEQTDEKVTQLVAQSVDSRAAETALMGDDDDDDVKYAESFEEPSMMQDDFANNEALLRNTSADDNVMRSSVTEDKPVLVAASIVTAIGSNSMVTSISPLPSESNLANKSDAANVQQLPRSSEPFKTSLASQLFGSTTNSIANRPEEARRPSTASMDVGPTKTVDEAVAEHSMQASRQISHYEEAVYSQPLLEPPPRAFLDSRVSKDPERYQMHPSNAPRSISADMLPRDIPEREDNYHRQPYGANAQSNTAQETRFFPTTIVEETPDSYRDFEATIRHAVPPVKAPEPFYHYNDGFEDNYAPNVPTKRNSSLNRQIYAPNFPIGGSTATHHTVHATEVDIPNLIPSSGVVVPARHGPLMHHTGNRNLDKPQPRSKQPTIGHWPSELSLTAPSTTELHARIAVISSNRVRTAKLAASSLNRINEARRRAQLEAKYSSSRSHQQPVSEGRGVARLSYQRPTRSSGQGADLSPSSSRRAPAEARDTPGSQHRAKQISSSSRLIEQATVLQEGYRARDSVELRQHAQLLLFKGKGTESKAKGKSRSLLDGDDDCEDAKFGRARRSHSEPRRPKLMDDPWEVHALETIEKIMQKEENIGLRESELRQRESAIALRESASDAVVNKMAALKAENARLSAKPTQDVAKLHAELDSLKAQLYQDRQQRETIAKSAAALALEQMHEGGPGKPQAGKDHIHKHSQAVVEAEEATAEEEATNEPKDKAITVSRREYEKLVAECLSQESLIEGLQRENERLFHIMRDRELEDKATKATFFDQQEQMNRELNRLRNYIGLEGLAELGLTQADEQKQTESSTSLRGGGGPILLRKSGDMLRAELDLDATVRALRERVAIAESNAGAREKDLMRTIDNLRRENRELTEAMARNKQSIMAELIGEQTTLEKRNEALQQEVSQLKNRLVWFAENQELLEKIENEKDELRMKLNTLMTECQQRGLPAREIEQMLSRKLRTGTSAVAMDMSFGDPNDNTATATEQSMHSLSRSSGATSLKKNLRSLADIKKIRELEKTVKELQESIIKKNPNSIAALIKASSVSDSVRAERQQQQDLVEAVKNELKEAKEGYERRLRSLRQEHERIKAGYEAQLLTLQADLQTTSNGQLLVVTEAGRSGKQQQLQAGSSKSAARVRELEIELERVRAFYTRKVEETQKRMEAQLRAYKRNPLQPDSSEGNEAEGISEVIQSKLAFLESELLATAEELGTARKEVQEKSMENEDLRRQVERLKGIVETAPAPPPPPIMNAMNQFGNQQDIDVEKLVQTEVLKAMSTHSARVDSAQVDLHMTERLNELEQSDRRLKQELATKEEERELLVLKFEEERMQLHTKLRSELEKSSQLAAKMTAMEAELNKPCTPQQEHFNALASQVQLLDSRLQRREIELAAAIEESKASAKIERNRLMAIHEQELREKDEQLLRLEVEVQQIVGALRQWQASSGSGGPAPAPSGSYFPPRAPRDDPIFVK